MLDQIIIGNKASYEDFDASVAERTISTPQKKSIKETIPFSNVTYDFSAINGEVYWEERELKYVFEILADTPSELEAKKTEFSNWIMNVQSEEIYDPFVADYHYVGTFDSMDYADDESVEKTTATVKFLAYPYAIANVQTEHPCAIPKASSRTVSVYNYSAHRITPTIVTDAAITLKMGGVSYAIPKGETTDDVFKLSVGVNVLEIANTTGTDCTVVVKFYKEVF
jgi:hypothetical protein